MAEKQGITAIATCPDCEATLGICRHFDWCPTLEVNRLRDVLTDLLAYMETHRYSIHACSVCSESRCFEEWAMLRDEANALLQNGSYPQSNPTESDST